MDKYRLTLMHPEDFEEMTVRIFQELLGIGIKGFATGRDGGRDGIFEGKADKYPSDKLPWKGKFVIQAKHSSVDNSSCADKDFFGNKSSVINKEVSNIKKLKNQGQLDNYIVITNRKSSADAITKIENFIKTETSVRNVGIHGLTDVESWLKQSPRIVKEFELDKYFLPFEFYEEDIKETIVEFNEQIEKIKEKPPLTEDYFRPEIHEKNIINNLSNEYFESQIREKSLEYFRQIDDFLKNPINQEYTEKYRNTVHDLNELILVKRDSFDKFDEIFTYIFQYIFGKHEETLRKPRYLVHVFLHFMYYKCDIGRNR